MFIVADMRLSELFGRDLRSSSYGEITSKLVNGNL
jgi:hypothetical protein